MKNARRLIAERKKFIDWTKFINFLQSQSNQLKKFNFDKPLKGEEKIYNRRHKPLKAAG